MVDQTLIMYFCKEVIALAFMPYFKLCVSTPLTALSYVLLQSSVTIFFSIFLHVIPPQVTTGKSMKLNESHSEILQQQSPKNSNH